MSKVRLENRMNGKSYEFSAEGAALLLTNPDKWTKKDQLPTVEKVEEVVKISETENISEPKKRGRKPKN